MPREALTANLTFSVPGDFGTAQEAINYILNQLDPAGYNVTVALTQPDSGGVIVYGPPLGNGHLSLVIGEGGLIDTVNAHGVLVRAGARLKVRCENGGRIQTATTGQPLYHGVYALESGAIEATDLNFGPVAGSKIQAGGNIVGFGNHVSQGDAVSEFHAPSGVLGFGPGNYTLVDEPTYSAYFMGLSECGTISVVQPTFIGAAHGQKFICHKNAVINAGTKTRADIPGDLPGRTATGGQFIGASAPTREAFRMHKNGVHQTGVPPTLTIVQFGTEDYDTNAIAANSSVVPTAGVWRFAAQVRVTGAIPGAVLAVAIFKNGIPFAHEQAFVDGTGSSSCGVKCSDYAGGGDSYMVALTIPNTAGATIRGEPYYTYFVGEGA